MGSGYNSGTAAHCKDADMRITLATLLILITASANAADPPGSVAELLRALEHKDGTKRLHAAAALGELGAKAKAALPALVKALDDPHRIVRFYAAEAIGKVGGTLTPALKARLMKVVKTDESWIVARQAALALERLDPKGLWAHGILLQRPGEDSSPIVVPSPSPRPVSLRSIVYALHLLQEKDPNVLLSALYGLDSQHEAFPRNGGREILPLMFHAAERVRTAARRFISRLDDDGARAARLADLASDARKQKAIEKLLRSPQRAGGLMDRTMVHIASHPKEYPSNIHVVILLDIYRSPTYRFPELQPDRRNVPFAELRTERDRVLLVIGATDESRKYWREQLRTQDHIRLLGTLRVLSMPEVRARSLSAELAKLLGDARAGVGDGAMRALLQTEPDWQSIAKPLRNLLQSKDASQRRQAIDLLLTVESIRSAALPELRKAVGREPVAAIRERIIHGFHYLKAGDAATVETLTKRVAEDRDAGIRILAATTIARFGRKARGAVQPLFAALEGEKNPAVKLQIALALDRCMKPQSKARAAVQKLIVEYSRQIATATLRDIIRRQSELATDTQRQNVRDILGLKSRP
jgi:HEAT repeat protein